METNFLYLFYVALLGLAVGSFLNVLIFRFHTGRTLGGRSQCLSCSRTLSWFELIPVFSFLVLGARCRTCKAKLSWQYFFVELSTAILYVLAVKNFFAETITPESILHLAMLLVSFPLLVAIFAYDMRHKIIPDTFVYMFVGVTLVPRIIEVMQNGFVVPVLLNLLSGPILFTAFFLLWFLSRGKWMGFGDAKLVLGIGLMFGFWGGISAVVFGFWIGAIFGILAILISRLRATEIFRWIKPLHKVTLKSEVPFAPFLILGVLAVEFAGFSIIMVGL